MGYRNFAGYKGKYCHSQSQRRLISQSKFIISILILFLFYFLLCEYSAVVPLVGQKCLFKTKIGLPPHSHNIFKYFLTIFHTVPILLSLRSSCPFPPSSCFVFFFYSAPIKIHQRDNWNIIDHTTYTWIWINKALFIILLLFNCMHTVHWTYCKL